MGRRGVGVKVGVGGGDEKRKDGDRSMHIFNCKDGALIRRKKNTATVHGPWKTNVIRPTFFMACK